MRCITDACGRPLTTNDSREGHTKCRFCRSRGQGAHPFNTALRQPPPPPAARGDSWWMGAGRDGFTSEAERRHEPRTSNKS